MKKITLLILTVLMCIIPWLPQLKVEASGEIIRITSDNLLAENGNQNSWIPLWENNGLYPVYIYSHGELENPSVIQTGSWARYSPWKPYYEWTHENPSYNFSDERLD